MLCFIDPEFYTKWHFLSIKAFSATFRRGASPFCSAGLASTSSHVCVRKWDSNTAIRDKESNASVGEAAEEPRDGTGGGQGPRIGGMVSLSGPSRPTKPGWPKPPGAGRHATRHGGENARRHPGHPDGRGRFDAIPKPRLEGPQPCGVASGTWVRTLRRSRTTSNCTPQRHDQDRHKRDWSQNADAPVHR